MTTTPGWTGRRIALSAAVTGALLVATCLLASTWSQFAATSVPRDWAGEPLHLTTDGRAERCVVDPREGPQRSVTVPARPPRSALKIVGTRIDPWFSGNATIACTGPVQATRGPVLALYPLSEREPWVILPGAVLLGAGWVYSALAIVRGGASRDDRSGNHQHDPTPTDGRTAPCPQRDR